MFGKTKIVEKIVKDPKDEALIKELQEKIADLKDDQKNKDADHAREVKDLKHGNQIAIDKAVAEKDKEINKLTVENAQFKTKNEVLEKAFSNMGFDVKDMKQILNKLVDGLVAKNQIQLVK